ncbi:MAG: HAMP domain-containing histidine kinase [Chlorobi bacterium]|nr:HAMP domain-containing histidine kinase [Chlorobiota bacterium]
MKRVTKAQDKQVAAHKRSATWSERQLLRRRFMTLGFTIVAVLISGGVLIYTQRLVTTLIAREQRLVRFYAQILESFATSNSIEGLFLLDRVTPTIDFPCIITDSMGIPLEPLEQFTLNLDFRDVPSKEEHRRYVQQLVARMAQEYPPIEIRDTSGRVINYIYYTNSWVVKRLRVLPYAEIAIVSLFIAAGYGALSMQRRRDESLIWVGMAKETAHQLGTPISSMLGWLEILQDSLSNGNVSVGDAAVLQALSELQADIQRLSEISRRFSLIGSQPILSAHDVVEVVERSVRYMETRLPKHTKTIVIERDYAVQSCSVAINAELLSWVIENLIKNAIEAIEQREGRIVVSIQKLTKKARRSEQILRVAISDNGRGMTPEQRRYAHIAGYTTKERGWGLGLSLSKRIIEEYHRGKLIILRSIPSVGTTIAIDLSL